MKMKNILILASGSVAKNFIQWVSEHRVGENHYYVVSYKEETLPDKLGKNITLLNFDPTSFSKLSATMRETQFTNVFVVMDEKEDAKYTLKNIAHIHSKVRTVFLNQWTDEHLGEGVENLTVLNSENLIAAHLYDNLPNVPLVAQNVGLGSGEIMEVLIPFGSSYAYRHVGSIRQRKWKIAALYRDQKQILPTSATMIRPNDTVLIVGKPLVLAGVYKTINKRIGLFPEPFGKNIYLVLNLRYDSKEAIRYIEEAIHLLSKLENKFLYIRILFPNDFAKLEEIKAYENEYINIHVSYVTEGSTQVIEYDINQYDIGLVFTSIETFETDKLKYTLYALKKIVYLFGDRQLQSIEQSIILMGVAEKMESISATALDVSESLGLTLMLGDYDPEGDFESKKKIIEHYETLTHIFNMKIVIEQKVANPIRVLSQLENILQIAPFEKSLNTDGWVKLFSSKVQDFILTTNRHPKILVPFALAEGKED